MEPARIRIRRMWISCTRAIGCGFHVQEPSDAAAYLPRNQK